MNTLNNHHDVRASIAPGLLGRDILTEVETRALLRRPHLENEKQVAPDPPPAAKNESKPRRRTLLIMAALIAALGAAFYYVWFIAPYETTDDAFIQNHAVSISTKLSNIVQKLLIDDNQLVQKGQLLIQIDPRDYQVALLYAQADYDTAKSNYDRDVALVGNSAVSKEDVDDTRAAYEEAEARLDQAKLNLEYTHITAPVTGYITNRTVEAGAYVQAGETLFSIVPKKVWVVANYKETQLAHMRPGDLATVRVDAYPQFKFKGHVDSIQAGSGAQFSLFPPENATGNYVKVVQRVPVKILLDDPSPPGVVLGPGMSVDPSVRVK
jgi:membrane fusion protein (multidrug efflux system)